MGLETMHYLRCDDCQDGWDDYYGTDSIKLIKSAKADGWVFRKGKCLCNFCNDKTQERDN